MALSADKSVCGLVDLLALAFGTNFVPRISELLGDSFNSIHKVNFKIDIHVSRLQLAFFDLAVSVHVKEFFKVLKDFLEGPRVGLLRFFESEPKRIEPSERTAGLFVILLFVGGHPR